MLFKDQIIQDLKEEVDSLHQVLGQYRDQAKHAKEVRQAAIRAAPLSQRPHYLFGNAQPISHVKQKSSGAVVFELPTCNSVQSSGFKVLNL